MPKFPLESEPLHSDETMLMVIVCTFLICVAIVLCVGMVTGAIHG